MKPTITWDKDRTVGMVMSGNPSCAPYLGVLRRQDLLDGWTASSSLYDFPVDLGVFADEHEALEAVLADAQALFDRRATSKAMADARRDKINDISVKRVTGAGRSEVDPLGADEFRRKVSPFGSKRGRHEAA